MSISSLPYGYNMDDLIETVKNDCDLVEHFVFHYRGINIIFDFAEICKDKTKDRYVNRVCRLKRMHGGSDTIMKAEIDEYKVVRKIEKELPSDILRMDPNLKMTKGGK